MPDLTMQDVIVDDEASDGLSLADVVVEPDEATAWGGMASPLAAGAMAAMKMAPGIVSGVHKVAGVGASGMAKGASALGAGYGVYDAAKDVVSGNFAGAAKKGAVSAAVGMAPKALGVIQKMTAPLTGRLASGAKYTLKPGMAGAMTRGAGMLSKVAGPIGVAAMLYDLLQGARSQAAHDRANPDEDRERALLANTHAQFP